MQAELESDDGRSEFLEEFWEKSIARLQIVEARTYHLTMVNFIIVGLLFIGVFTKGASISLLEMDASDFYNIKEFALFVSATIILFSTMMRAHVNSVKDDLFACGKYKYGEHFSQKMKEILPGDPFGSKYSYLVYEKGGAFPGVASNIFHAICIFLVILIGVLYVGAILYVHIYLLTDVFYDPSVPPVVSWIVIVYVASVDLLSIFLGSVHVIPFRYVDYRYVGVFEKIREVGSDAYGMVCKGIYLWGRRPRYKEYAKDFALWLIVLIPLYLMSLEFFSVIDGRVGGLFLSISIVGGILLSLLLSFFRWKASISSYISDNYDDLSGAVEKFREFSNQTESLEVEVSD